MTPATPLRVAADLFRTLWWIGALVWAGLFLLFGTIGTIMAATGGLEQSIWIGACWWSQYLMLGAGAVVTTQFLRVYVGNGITRRAFGLGAALLGMLGSLLFGVLMELGFVIERGVALAQGWQQFPASADFVASPAHILQSTVEFSLLHVAYFFTGWLISVTFYRLGVLAGLAVIAPAMLPALLMDVVKLGAQPTAEVLAAFNLTGFPHSALVGIDALIVAAVAVAGYRLMRFAPIKTT